jgi:hypothetical protein
LLQGRVRIPDFFPFVNRDLQCRECEQVFQRQFDGGNEDSAPHVSAHAALKNYEMVIIAGGPGIGQSPMLSNIRIERADCCSPC